MTKNRRFLMIASLIFALVVYIFIRENDKRLFQVQDVDQVASVELIPSHAGADDTVILIDVQKASEIIKELHEAKLVGQASNQFTSMGGCPTTHELKIKKAKVKEA